MLKEIHTDRELRLLRRKDGYVLNIDFGNYVVKLHRTSCRFCNPEEVWGIKVESKIAHKTGETWYAESIEEADAKAAEMVRNRGFSYSSCKLCNPLPPDLVTFNNSDT